MLLPKPAPLYQQISQRLLRKKPMTVCIAAACNRGDYLVTCTDGALTNNGETFDLTMAKMVWFDDWQFMYTGEPSNADLILENIRHERRRLTRENIQIVVRAAFRKRLNQWISDYVLSPFDIDVKGFKAKGKRIFTDKVRDELTKELKDATNLFNEEIMVVGWGSSSRSVMIYGCNRYGPWSGSLTGIAAVGSGGTIATSTLLSYGINRSSSLEDALYAVAAAKFSAAERGEAVRQNTTVYVSRKRTDEDPADERIGEFLSAQEIKRLYRAWVRYGRARVPDEARQTLMAISQRVSGGVNLESLPSLMRSISRRSRRAQ